MSRFRPCIDLHHGKVKQIIGGTLRDDGLSLVENHVSDHDAAWFAQRYRDDQLHGGHVICLGPGNEPAARAALAAWPGGLQVGGGIQAQHAKDWIAAGASHVIITSYLFDSQGRFLPDHLEACRRAVGRDHLVLDLSCRRDEAGWHVAMNRWQTRTEWRIELSLFEKLAPYCAEFLIHAADVEGRCSGVDAELVAELSTWDGIPITYAGGVTTMSDVHAIQTASAGQLDFTVGSALDLFGGKTLCYADLIAWNQQQSS